MTDHTSSVAERHDAYRHVLTRHRLPYRPAWSVQSPEIEYAAGRVGLSRLLELPAADRPTAVFATNDLGAMGVLAEAADRGLVIPRDLSIVGFDDLRIAVNLPVPLTTVRQNLREIGRQTGILVLDRLEDKTLPLDAPQTIRVPGELIVRESSATPATR
jgi:LacI family transcriptional regulator